jgi:hypothetical protein
MSPADAVEARRRLTNKLIAAKDASRLRPFFATATQVIVGDGDLILGVDAVIDAFAGQFRDPDFIDYVRTPELIEPDEAETRAAERGRWVGRWKGHEMAGTYLACWKKVTGQWVIESELYVTLS